MPEIKHTGAEAPPATPIPGPSPAAAAQAVVASGITSDMLKEALKKLSAESKPAKASADSVDWTKISEIDVANPAVFIPVIEHEIPDYMNMKLKDEEYVAVWANRDQRRLGQLTAEGYEFLREEHVHPDFKLPLLFGSDKQYTYADVVCMRVHKRILFSKRRAALDISRRQLKNTNRPPRARVPGTDMLEAPVTLDTFQEYYDAVV